MVFEKLFKFVGKNIKSLVDRADEPYCFRLQKNRVYYVREALMKRATNVSRHAAGHAAVCLQGQPVDGVDPMHACFRRYHVTSWCPWGHALASSHTRASSGLV